MKLVIKRHLVVLVQAGRQKEGLLQKKCGMKIITKCAVGLLAGSVFGQQAILSGTVRDPGQNILPGVTVM